jgi:repressor LexA
MPSAAPLAVTNVARPTLDPMGVRVRRQRRRLGLTLDDLAARAGMSKPYLSLIETGRVGNPPSDEKLGRLEEVLQFPRGELLGQAHLQRTPPAVRAVLAELLRAAGTTPSPSAGGDPLAAALLGLIDRAGNDVEAVASTVVPALRPMADATAAGPDFAPESVDGFVGCPGLTDPTAFAAGVTGDAMAPRFHDGDIVVFSPTAEVRSGDDCYVRLTDGRTTFRRVFHEPADGGGGGAAVRLQPRNERYRPLTVPATDVAGVCRAVFRYERLSAEPSH